MRVEVMEGLKGEKPKELKGTSQSEGLSSQESGR